MKRTLFLILVVLLSSALAACGGGSDQTPAEGALDLPEPPAEYAGVVNPKAGDAAAAEAGGAFFAANCAACHGQGGAGDGPAGGALNPAPGNLAETQKAMSDAYLYWRIADGGMLEPFRSAMPAWKSLLTEDQIWELITFIRTLGG